MVRRKLPLAGLAPEEVVPPLVDAAPTDVLEVGHVRSFQARTGRWRPAPGGVSVGHFRVTAGTLGCVVRDRRTGQRAILSNNHVLADNNAAQPGDPILQPGAVDGGREENDTIARLERFVPILFQREPATCGLASGVAAVANAAARLVGSKHRLEAYRIDPQATNTVDAAVARPLEDALVSDEILDIGVISGVAPAELAMAVRKSGRSSGFTTGQISVLDATVVVDYGGRMAQFEGQIVTGAMSRPGDSGSLLVAADSLRAVGLLFAGSEQATIYNPIQAVLDSLEVVI
jgi:hypothetical protein